MTERMRRRGWLLGLTLARPGHPDLQAVGRDLQGRRRHDLEPGRPQVPQREKIAIFAPDTESGTYDFFNEKILGDPADGGLKPRSDYTASSNDNTLVQGIEGQANSWGYFGFAIYLEEFAPRNRVTNFVEANISNLAGVPSVVYGLLGLGIFARFLRLGPSLLAGALTLAVMSLPVIIVAAREAIRAVPDGIRLGAYALGATKWQTVRRQVLPAAMPGTLTGTILALSRAIGETAPLLVIGLPIVIFSLPNDLRDPVSALPLLIFDWTSRPQPAFAEAAAAASIVLLALLLAMNAVAIFLRNRYTIRW